VHVCADERDPHTWLWPHTKTLENADVAVPAADEHDVSKDGLIRCLHTAGSLRCGLA
jgi:hypothetical protein